MMKRYYSIVFDTQPTYPAFGPHCSLTVGIHEPVIDMHLNVTLLNSMSVTLDKSFGLIVNYEKK